ncbi:hypothetical protein [Neorhizobium galegae]|uniref:hypothetical protein n=1 Tax=Neorhizobium galegae TaxID=399 RepID=UPI0006223DD7|nr:hypothetical protein [Neorhizobium galegae]CDZ55063.1 Hypothetical protein NGAL_HAMBI2427_59730 [Neorhizobium galegae bv. orientalis]
MADPTPYTPGYDYSDFEASNPTLPKPGAQLDNDFANIATSIDETIDALKDVRRSDGKLKNAIVTVDSLSTDVKALLGQNDYLEIVGDNIDSVVAVAESIDDVNALAPLTAQIAALAPITASIQAVGAIDDQVVTVAAISTHVTTVAGIGASVVAVAGISSAVSAVAAIDDDVALVATNIVAVQNASANAIAAAASANAASTSAGNAASSASAAATSAANAASTITGATVDDTIDDTDALIYVTGTTIKKGALTGLIASVFKTARTIANAQFAAATFKLFNAAGTPRALTFDLAALTADRVLTMPNANVDLSTVQAPFVSTQQVITSGGLLTLAHGLSATPTIFQFDLVCATTEANYSPPNVVPLVGMDMGDTSRGAAVTADATNIYVRYGSAASVFVLPNKTTGTGAALTNGNWRLIVRAKVS